MEKSGAGAGSGGGRDEKQWGTWRMGRPTPPSSHPANEEAAAAGWRPRESDTDMNLHVLDAADTDAKNRSSGKSILDAFDSWSRKAEQFATQAWHNLVVAPSKTEYLMGKLKLTTKAVTEGGFEELYKKTFPAAPGEKLTGGAFACYLSTSAGPVAGTLYSTDRHVAFASDRPLSYHAPSGAEVWSYYKIMVPVEKVSSATTAAGTAGEEYVKVATVDGFEFWFMGFVSGHEKVLRAVRSAVGEAIKSMPVTEPLDY